jgi:hypothetical protein
VVDAVYRGPRHNSLNQVVHKRFVWSPIEFYIWGNHEGASILNDSHYFCTLVPELFSLAHDMSMSSAEGAALMAAQAASTAEGLRPGRTRSQSANIGNLGVLGAVQEEREDEEEDEEEPGSALQNLFRNPRELVLMWKDADMISGSKAAEHLVTEQRANRLALCAKAILATPEVVVGLVFMTVVTREDASCNVVWQIMEFQEAAQVFRAQRMSVHPETLLFPSHAIFSVSTVEVLISPTLPFLNQVLDTLGTVKATTVASFPIPERIIVPSAPNMNLVTHAMDFQLLHYDMSYKGRLTVPMPRPERETAVAASSAGESTESSRRVKSVPAGTTHWFLCDEIMLVGSRNEEVVYSCMIHGGARTAPGAMLKLGIGLLLRMTPKDARNLLSLRITSSTCFDAVTMDELKSLRCSGEKSDVLHFQLGECARLAYRRVCNCQEILFRLFELRPRVMEVWATFAAQILDIIENGAVRYPGIAGNGVICQYVDAVLLHFFSQLHTPGLTAVGSDAALTLLRLDTRSEVFMRLQLDAEFRQFRGQGAKRVMPEATGARGPTEDPPAKKSRPAGEKKKASAYCFAFFAVDGCTHGQACRFSHKKPVTEADKGVIRAGVLQRNGTLRADAF